MAGFSKRDGVFHGLTIPDLADQNHVRRLAQGIFQRNFIRLGIDTDFALGHQTILVVMHEFDRILDGNDMTMRVAIAVVHHRCQRGRLTRARAAYEDDQATLGHRDILQDRRQVEFVETGDLGVDDTQHHARAATLHEGIDTKTRHARQGDGEVTFLVLFEFRHLLVVHDRTRQDLGMIRGQILLRDRRHLAVDFHRRRRARGNEKVRPVLANHHAQQVVHEADGLTAIHVISFGFGGLQ